jgi:uncharacterized membrane protein YkoI
MVRRTMKQIALALFTAVILTGAAAPAQAGCVPWKSAGALISKNSLISGGAIYGIVQAKTGGKVISASLCQNGSRFVYKVVVLGKKGDVRKLNVDARTGRF